MVEIDNDFAQLRELGEYWQNEPLPESPPDWVELYMGCGVWIERENPELECEVHLD